MRCRRTRSFLSAYSNDELIGRQKRAVAEHLAECTECRREEAVYRSMNQARQSIPEYKTSADFNNLLLDRITRERFAETRTKAYLPKRPPVLTWGRAVPVVVATCIIILVAVVAFNPSGTFIQNQPIADNTGLDNSYLTAQPINNPNMTASLDKNWSFNNQLAKTERISQISNQLSNVGSFGATSNVSDASVHSSKRIPYATNYYRVRPFVKAYISSNASTSREVQQGY